MKKPGFYYNQENDVLFVVYPNGSVEFFTNSGFTWHQSELPKMWSAIIPEFDDKFVGDL